jgi:hypothetical protein
MDEHGQVQLPPLVRSHLTQAPRIGVEIRPEGVLLRPESDEIELGLGHEPQDAPPPPKRHWFGRGGSRKKT